MANIICRSVSFGYPASENEVFNNLDLLIDTQWRSALVGRNGRGKSTLLKLLHRDLEPTSGHIEIPVATRLFPNTPANPTECVFAVVKDATGPFRQWEEEMERLLDDKNELSVARYCELEQQYEEANGYKIDGRIECELESMGLSDYDDRPFANLSGGEQTRALLAALFVPEDGYPLIDEPTSHLDMAGRERVASYLATKRGFLIVSHDRSFLDEATDHVVSLNKADTRTQRGSYSVWRNNFLAEQHQEVERSETLRRQIRKLSKAAVQRRDSAQARETDKAAHTDKGYIGHRAAKQMKRALNIERRRGRDVEERRGLLKNQEKIRDLKVAAKTNKRTNQQKDTRKILFAVNGLSVRIGERLLLRGFALRLSKGERIAVLGPNGCGKTTLLNLVCGDHAEFAGDLTRAPAITISRAHQQPRWTIGSLPDQLYEAGYDATRFRQIMATMGVSGHQLDRPLETFSQGELKKVDLTRTFMEPVDLLVWDEPLNYIDIETREQIIDVVLRDKPTVLFVEHDRHFVERVATRVIELDANGTPIKGCG
ncbi:MAG: ABC-F family ATP-binding cassette domain-containing protein [Gammaproteobacteria bacterium]|nr:ABC-F family ATP-binding cassette domain-containing protein [Gammaproteobacteria bacterium]